SSRVIADGYWLRRYVLAAPIVGLWLMQHVRLPRPVALFSAATVPTDLGSRAGATSKVSHCSPPRCSRCPLCHMNPQFPCVLRVDVPECLAVFMPLLLDVLVRRCDEGIFSPCVDRAPLLSPFVM